MEEKKEKNGMNIYSEAIKTIVGYTKRSLLDFIDALENDSRNREILGRIKGRVHNDLSQCALNLGVLFATWEAGGNITPFEDNLISKKSDYHHHDRPNKKYSHHKENSNKPNNNPVIKENQDIKTEK